MKIIVKFCLAGVPGIILYYLILWALTDLMSLWYMFSAIIASVVNHTSNFILQKIWTFENKNTKHIHKQAVKYFLLALFQFTTNLVLLNRLVECLHLWYLVAQAIVTVILTITSFIISKKIFNHQPQLLNLISN